MTAFLTSPYYNSGSGYFAECPLTGPADTASFTISIVDGGGAQVVADHYTWSDGTGSGPSAFEAGPYTKWQQVVTVSKTTPSNGGAGYFWSGAAIDDQNPGNPWVSPSDSGGGAVAVASQLDGKQIGADIYWLYKTANFTWPSGAPTAVGQTKTLRCFYSGQAPRAFDPGTNGNWAGGITVTAVWSDGQVATQNSSPTGTADATIDLSITITPDRLGKSLTIIPRVLNDNPYNQPSKFLTAVTSPEAAAMASVTETWAGLTQDATNPSITITSPTTGYTIAAGATEFPLSFTVSDNVHVQEVVFYRRASGSGTDVVIQTLTANYPTTITSPGTINIPCSDMVPGQHTVYARATDYAGNTNTNSISVSKAAVAITASVSATKSYQATPSSVKWMTGTISLKAAASSLAGLTDLYFYVSDTNGNGAVSLGHITNPTGSEQIVALSSWVVSGASNPSLGIERQLVIKGYVGPTLVTTSNAVNFGIDDLLNDYGISSPVNGASFPGTGTINCDLYLSDDASGPDKVYAIIDGGSPRLCTSIGGGVWRYELAASSLSLGYHSIGGKFYDKVGNIVTTASDLVTFNVTSSTRSITSVTPSPASTGNGLKGTVLLSTVTVGTADGDQLRFYLDGVNLNITQTQSGASNNNWSVNWNTVGTTDGAHVLMAKVFNNSGVELAAKGINIIVDNQPPIASFTTNVNGSKLVLSGTASDAASGLGTVDYIIDGINTLSLRDTTTGYGPGQTFTINKTTADLVNGTHTIAVLTTDKVGNTYQTAAQTVTTPQVASSIAGATQQGTGGTIYGIYHRSKIVFVGTASILTSVFTGTPSVKVFLDGSATPITTTPDGTQRIFSTLDVDTTTLADGLHTATFKLYETQPASSAVERATTTINFTVDNTGPVVSNFSYDGTSGLINLSAATTDAGSGINKVEFYVGTPVPAKVGQSTSAPFSYAWDSSVSGAGSYSYYVVVTDNVGNITSTQSSAKTLVVTPPAPVTVYINDPLNGATVSGTTVAVSAQLTGSQVGQVANVKFFIIDNAGAETEVATDSTSPYSITLNSTTYTDGNYFLVARAYNSTPAQLGNDSNFVYIHVKNSNSVVVTAQAPSGVSGTQTFGATTSGTLDHVKWYARTTNPYTPTITAVGAQDGSAPYSTTQDTTVFQNGTYYLYAVAENAGNSLLATSKYVAFNISNSSVLGTWIPELSHTGSSGPSDYRIVFPVKAYDASNNEIYAFNESTGELRNGTQVKQLVYELDPEPTPDEYCFYDGSTQINGVDPNPGNYTPWKHYKGLA